MSLEVLVILLTPSRWRVVAVVADAEVRRDHYRESVAMECVCGDLRLEDVEAPGSVEAQA